MREFFGISYIIIFISLMLTGCGGGSGDGRNPKAPFLPPLPSAVALSNPLDITISSMYLSWTQNNDSDFSSYKLYSSNTLGVTQSSTLLATITSNTVISKEVTGLSVSTKYYFRIYVCDITNRCVGSNEVNGITSGICYSLTGGIGNECDTEAIQDKLGDMLDTRFPPEQYSITLNPEAPAAGEPTSIEVEIYNPSDATRDETSNVSLYYSVDYFESWEVIELETNDDKVWTGELPAFEYGDELIYSVRAVDTSTNIFVTVACKTDKEYDLSPNMRIDGDCVREDIATCEDGTPRGCLFRIAGDDTPGDDKTMPTWGDLVDYRVGYDDNNMYVDLAVEGTISGGTMTPTDIHLYAVAIVNKNRIGNDTRLDALLESSGVLVFSPLFKQFESTGYVSDCFLRFKQGDSFEIDSKNVKCINKENHILFVVPWETVQTLGINKTNVIQLFALTGSVTDISDFNQIKGYILDNSNATNVYFTDDTYFVVQ